jgi:hypothetical protein
MTSISPYYTVYAPPPPPPPPPPPVILDVNGNPKEPDVVVVIGQKADPYRNLLPYKGLTGAAENARRDQAFAMAGPENRCRMLGMDPNAEVGLPDDNSSTFQVGNTSNPYLLSRGVSEIQLNPDRFSHILAEHSGSVAGKSTFSPALLNPTSFAKYVLEPVLASNPPVAVQGSSLVFEGTVPWAGQDANGLLSERVRIVLIPARDGSAGAMEVLTAYPISGRL